MSYQNTVITRYSTEIVFLQEFISALTAADSRISCSPSELTPVDGCYSFTVTIDNDYDIEFSRYSSNANKYFVRYPDGSSKYIEFCTGSCSIDDTTTRTFKFMVIANSESIILGFGDFDSNGVPFEFMEIKTKDVSNQDVIITAYSSYSSSYLIQRDFLTSDNVTVSKTDRIPYTNDLNNAASIEIIKNKIFVLTNSDAKALIANKLWDTSTLTAGSQFTIDDISYYSLDDHTIMEI